MKYNLNCSTKLAALLVLLLVLSIARTTQAATYTKVQFAGTATWNGSANWVVGDQATVPTVDDGLAGVPNAIGDIAILQQKVSTTTGTTATINLATADETVGVLSVRNVDNTYTTVISSNTGKLIFDNGGDSATAQLNESGGAAGSTASIRLRVTAPVQLNSDLLINQTFLPDRNTVTEFAGTVSGSANITITKTGVANMQFGGTDPTGSFFGDVNIQQGALRMIIPNGSPVGTVNGILNQSKGVYVHDGTQIQFGNGMNVFTLGSNPATVDGKAELILEGLGDTSNAVASLPDGALRFDETAGTALNCDVNAPLKLQSTGTTPSPKIYVASADVAGKLNAEVRGDATAGLIKGGLGMLKLMAPNGNTYAGTTNISKGTLSVNNTNSATSGVGGGGAVSASVLVNDTGSGSALGGTGYIGTVAHHVNVVLTGDPGGATTGARLYPGDVNTAVAGPSFLTTSVGALTIHGGLSFDAFSSLNIDMTGDSAYDKVIADGAISLGGAGLNFNLGGFSPSGNGDITLIDNQGVGAISGVFGSLNGTPGSLAQGAPVTLGTATYHITYTGGTGNDVVLLGATVGVPGDYNNNGFVDAADYVLWRKGGPLVNEVDNPGVVNAQDYIEWRARFGNPAGSGNALGVGAVPEPVSAILLALAAPFWCMALARNSFGRTRS